MSESKTFVPVLSKGERTKLWDSMAMDTKVIRSAKYYQGLPLHPYCVPTKDERFYITHSGLIQSELNPLTYYTLSHYPLAEDTEGKPSPMNGHVITVWESEGSQHGYNRKYRKRATFTPPFAHYDPLLCNTYNDKGEVVKLSKMDEYDLTTSRIPSWLSDMRKSLESISPEPLLRTLQEKFAESNSNNEGMKAAIGANIEEIKKLYMIGSTHHELSKANIIDERHGESITTYPFSKQNHEVVRIEWPYEFVDKAPHIGFKLVQYSNRMLNASEGLIDTMALQVTIDQKHAIPNTAVCGVVTEGGKAEVQSVTYIFNLDSRFIGQGVISYTSYRLNKYGEAAIANSQEAKLSKVKVLQMIDSYLQLMVKAIYERRGKVSTP